VKGSVGKLLAYEVCRIPRASEGGKRDGSKGDLGTKWGVVVSGLINGDG